MFKKRIELDENMNHQVKCDTTTGNAKKRKGEIRKKNKMNEKTNIKVANTFSDNSSLP